jgi:Asp-tRNA(Asn)/Glu-tRNA(Gln) amidotransferase A subunit family amidase
MMVGVIHPAFERFLGPNKAIYDQALEDLKKAGVAATTVDYQEDMTQIRFLLEAEAAAAFDDITRDGQVRTLRGQNPQDWPNSFRSSRLIPAVEYIRAQRVRTLLVEKFEKFMEPWDALVIPAQALLTTTNLTGNPQVVVKCGFTEATLQNGAKTPVPRTLGFLGKIYDEGAPLRVALAYEQATEWHRKNPTL